MQLRTHHFDHPGPALYIQDDNDQDKEAEVPNSPGVLEEVDLGGCKDGVGVSLAEELFEAAARQVDENQGCELLYLLWQSLFLKEK